MTFLREKKRPEKGDPALLLIYRAERCIIHPPLCGGRSRSSDGVKVTKTNLGEEGDKTKLAKAGRR